MTKRKIHALQGDLRAGDADGLRTTLMAHLEAGNLKINTAAVTAVDAAILQVLISARRTAAALGRTLTFDFKDGTPFAQFADRMALREVLRADA